MSDTQRPLGDDRPTGPEPVGLASGPQPAAATRTVLAKGERVPWPRRLIATGLLAAVLALTLHALPRPYQSIPTGVVRGLGDAYGNLRSSYHNEVAALEPVAGEASAAERKAYARELWRYRWLGSFREILLRFSEWLAASCMLIALSMIVVERRRTKRSFAARGARTAPAVLRHETLAGDAIAGDTTGDGARPALPSPVSTPPAPGFEATPPFPMTRFPVRETGDEVTPPSPTPVPKVGALQLRPATFDDDDDLGRTTEGQAPNLAKLPVVVKPASPDTAVEASKALPVFFAERRHPEPHPVVHPGDPPPAEPMPTPPPGPSGPSALPRAAEPVTAAPAADDDSLPAWLKTPRTK